MKIYKTGSRNDMDRNRNICCSKNRKGTETEVGFEEMNESVVRRALIAYILK